MKNGKTCYVFNILAVAILFIALTSLVSCSEPGGGGNSGPDYGVSYNDSGNKVLIVKRGIGRFSLEIPPTYELGNVEVKWGFIDVYLKGRPSSDGKSVGVISVFITDRSANPEAKVAMEKSMDFAAEAFHNFQLIDISSITVAGVPGYRGIIIATLPKNFPNLKWIWSHTRL